MKNLFDDDMQRKLATANVVSGVMGVMGVLFGLSLLVSMARINTLETANKELAAVALSHCSAVRVGDMAWMTMLDGEERCVKTVALPTREMYNKPLVKPKAKL